MTHLQLVVEYVPAFASVVLKALLYSNKQPRHSYDTPEVDNPVPIPS